ncbi:3-oxoacyl-[acyl-carrier protein] reductase [Izhakiella capsodis]|uniref:3-oxoacyl-[acyl-carrier protein] reductase n=1 Tax=Izhakiella capsodis TaxID=1367852 RepID=A0A1I5AD32_9GAMM|nr:3-oxoacyl-[acyl-carrier protein] reductase [Izhakiella capsodis]
MKLKKRIFVTSGDSGIGKSIVKKLTDEGYKVVFTYRSKKSYALEIANDINQKGGCCLCFYCDVRHHESLNNLCSSLIKSHGAPYGIINNSGMKNDKLLINTEFKDWQEIIDTNLNGPFYAIRSLLPSMINVGDGCVITISSVSALRGNVG